MDELDFDLPAALIAQEPPPQRTDARLLHVPRKSGVLREQTIADLPGLLRRGDLLIVNDTRVIPAKLRGQRATGGRVDFLLLHPQEDGVWESLVRCGGSLRSDEVVTLEDGQGIRLLENRGEGHWLLRGEEHDLRELMQADGRMPLPPYIQRAQHDARDVLDRERYQTTFARADGAVAAPTAGLHLTPALLESLAEGGIDHAPLTLHVGLGTFAPVRSDRLEDHPMHVEHYEISTDTARRVRATKEAGGRIIAVGTTSVRALEASAAHSADGLPTAGRTETDLLISPGFSFRVVDGLLTNFHLPRSTLLALVGAFMGLDWMHAVYRHAIAEKYRFFSYGDAMLIQ